MLKAPVAGRALCMAWALAWIGCQVPGGPTPRPSGPVTPAATGTPRPATQPVRPAASVSTPDAEVVARVNGEPITRKDLVDSVLERYGRKALEDLILYRLVQQAATQAGVQVTDKEVETFIRSRARRMGLPASKLAQIMHTDRRDWHRRVWQQMVVQKIVERDVEVTDQDMRLAYESGYGETMDAAWIRCGTMRDAQRVWEQLRGKPDQFGRLARQESVDESTRSLNGKLQHPVRRHMFVPEVEREVFKLRDGEISPVVQTRLGYAIFKCIKRFPARPEEFEKVREKLRDEVHKAKVKEAAKTFAADLTAKARIETPLYPDLIKRKADAVPRRTTPGAPVSPIR